MKKGYLIAQIHVHDKEGLEKFRKMTGPIIIEYEGKVLVKESNPNVRKGNFSGIVLII